MTTTATHTEERILAMVYERGHILLEQLPSCLPGSTWNQVFLSVDALSRQGSVRLRRRGCDYEVWIPAPPPDSVLEGPAIAVIRPTALTLS